MISKVGRLRTLCAAMAALGMGAVPLQAAYAEAHSVVNVVISDISVFVNGVAVAFASGAAQGGLFNFAMGTLADVQPVPAGSAANTAVPFNSAITGFNDTLGPPAGDGSRACADGPDGGAVASCVDPLLVGQGALPSANSENEFLTEGPGVAFTDGAAADGIIVKTAVTGVQAGANLFMYTEADVQAPPDAVFGTASITSGLLRWTFCTSNSTVAGCAPKELTVGDIVTVTGTISGTVLAEVLAPLGDNENANASTNISVQVGDENLSKSITRSASVGTPSQGGVLAGADTSFSFVFAPLTAADLPAANAAGISTLPFNIAVSSSSDATSFTVPEPGSLALVGAGLLGLGAVARRRQSKKAA